MAVNIYLHILNDFHDTKYFYNINDTIMMHFFSRHFMRLVLKYFDFGIWSTR